MNLTIAEIKHLAEFAGLTVDASGMEDEMDSEITVAPCPEEGIKDEDGITTRKYTGHIAYFAEYPEEGCIPLGEVIVKIWYMRDNHTFRELSLDPAIAKQEIAEEFGRGYTCGMLCTKSVDIDSVHAQGDLEPLLAKVDSWYEDVKKRAT